MCLVVVCSVVSHWCYGFLPQSKDKYIKKSESSELPTGVNLRVNGLVYVTSDLFRCFPFALCMLKETPPPPSSQMALNKNKKGVENGWIN